MDNFFSFAESLNSFVVAMALDSKLDSDVYKLLSSHFDIELAINFKKSKVKLTDRGIKKKISLPSVSPITGVTTNKTKGVIV